MRGSPVHARLTYYGDGEVCHVSSRGSLRDAGVVASVGSGNHFGKREG